jgi:hypothetical protein
MNLKPLFKWGDDQVLRITKLGEDIADSIEEWSATYPHLSGSCGCFGGILFALFLLALTGMALYGR